MRIVVAMLLSGAVGSGVALMLFGLRRRPEPLASAALVLQQRGIAVGDTGPADTSAGLVRSHVGRTGVHILGALGFVDLDALRAQLRVLDKSLEAHAYEKLFGAVAGIALPGAIAAVASLAGWRSSPVFVLAAVVVLGAAGFLYPDWPMRERVEKRRQEFRGGLSGFLDLASILIAGGTHESQAMTVAAESGRGWAFDRIRDALASASHTGRNAWDLLNDLGDELGVHELSELAASITLSGAEGAAIKDTLSAKADSMRFAQIAETQASAERRTQKMVLPLMIVATGFILFIGFGVVTAMDTGFAPSSPSTTVTTAGR